MNQELELVMNTLIGEMGKMEARISARLDGHDRHFEAIEKRLDEHDKRFDAIEQRMGRIEQRMDHIEQRMDRIEQRMDRIEQRMDCIEQRMGHIEQRMDHIEQRMDHIEQRMDYIEQRMDYIEQRMDHMEKDTKMYVNTLVDEMGKMEARMNERFKSMDARLDSMQHEINGCKLACETVSLLMQKVDQHECRIQRLEKKMA